MNKECKVHCVANSNCIAASTSGMQNKMECTLIGSTHSSMSAAYYLDFGKQDVSELRKVFSQTGCDGRAEGKKNALPSVILGASWLQDYSLTTRDCPVETTHEQAYAHFGYPLRHRERALSAPRGPTPLRSN